jgi:hypothetical protein
VWESRSNALLSSGRRRSCWMDSEEACKYHHEPVAIANRTDQLDGDNKCKPVAGWVRGCWRAGPVASGVSPCPKNTKKNRRSSRANRCVHLTHQQSSSLPIVPMQAPPRAKTAEFVTGEKLGFDGRICAHNSRYSEIYLDGRKKIIDG